MTHILEALTNIKKAQNTVDKVLEAGEIVVKDGFISDNSGTMKRFNLWNNGASVGRILLQKKGFVFPTHVHSVIQYLICIKGSCSVSLSGTVRILEAGGCCSIPPGMPHSVMTLEDNTELIDVCVPKEPLYSS